MSNWGKGSENNNIGWGQAAHTATNDWGKSQKTSYAGLTDIVGDPALSISYPASALCENASNPTPTVSGNEGSGTFSSTTGLVFVSTSTGEVNISSSTAGATYLITYTDTNAATATFSLTINNLDNAAFAYSASSFEPTDADPTPTITGLTGGTFSAGSGLVFVDSGTNTGSSTGQIDLSATTESTYTITYDTTSSGSSVCPNTSTQSVEVAVAAIANNHSFSFDGLNDYIIAQHNSDLNLSTAFTISIWINISGGTSFRGILAKKDLSVAAHGVYSMSLIDASNNVRIYLNGATAGTTNTTLNNNTWYHLSAVYDGSGSSNADKLKLYIDGVNTTLNLATIPSSINSNTENLHIGAYYNTSLLFNGNIDELGIWNTALTASQIQNIYDATGTNLTKDLTTVSGSNLVYWNRMGD
jgi:hypothetical protein